MLSTESLAGPRALGEESLQMWDLNKRLEAYLARVKFLEEENEALRAEIRSAKGGPGGDSRRVKFERELRALRDALGRAFRDKSAAELARDNLHQEVQQVKSRCQKEQAAREEAKKQLALSRKELEEERRAQIWLKERAVQLQKEVEALLEVHEEEKAGLDQEIASFSRSLESFRCAPAAFQPVEVEDYSKRLSEIWKGAVETYKTEVSQLEGSLCQAKENLWKAVEDNQQSQLQLQHLERDLAGLRARKELLEESLAQQWQEQRGEAEKFQLAMEALEQEQQSLRVQIARVLEDRQQLMHLKMSLSLEVATYRTLLEAESARLQMPAGEFKLANGVRDLKLEVSRVVPASPETSRLLPRDCSSPSILPGAEGSGQPEKAPSDPLAGKRQSPGELQKISSALRGTAPSRAGGTAAPACSTPNPSQAGKAAPPLSPEPPSPSPPEQGSSGAEGPAWPGGVMSQGVGDAPGGTVRPLGALPAPGLLYPAQLVSEVLQDALKAMEDDAQPKEEPAWAPRDAGAPSPVFHTEGPGEEQEGSEGGDSPEEEERVEEVVLQALGVGQEDLGAWEEEEVPAVLSPRDPETEAREGDRDLPGQTVSSWEKPEQEEDRAQTPSTEPSHPSEEEEEEERGPHGPCKENGDFQEEGADVPQEECPHREEEAARAVLAESHLVLLTKGHLGENFVDAEQERCEQQKTPVCEMDLAAEQERGQELCPEQGVHEAIPAEEAGPGAEEDAVGGEDPGRVEDGEGEKGEASREVLGGEFPGVGQSPGVGEESGPAGERGAGEGSEAGGGDSPERESRAPEDTQESSSVEEEEQKAGEDAGHGQEPCPEDTEGVWGPEEPDDSPSSSGELESEERGGTAAAEPEEAQGADEGDARRQEMRRQLPEPGAEAAAELAGHGQQDSVAQAEAAPAAAPGQGHGQEPAQAAGEHLEGQEGDDGEDGHTQDPAQAPEELWKGQEDDDDDDGHTQEPAQDAGEHLEGQEDDEDDDEHTQEPAQAPEELWKGQDDDDDDEHKQDPAQAHADDDDGHREDPAQAPGEPWEHQNDGDGDDGHRQELNEAPEELWEQQGDDDDDRLTQDPAQAPEELWEQQGDDDGHRQELNEAPEEPWEGQGDDAADDELTQDPALAPEEPWEQQNDDDGADGHTQELNEAPEELWKGQEEDDDDEHKQDPAQAHAADDDDGHREDPALAPEEPWEQQEEDDDDDGHTQDPAQAPEEPWEQQGDDADGDDGHRQELNEAPEELWKGQEDDDDDDDDGHRQDPAQALKELREQQEDDDDGHRQELNEASEEPWEQQEEDDDDDGLTQELNEAPEELWKGQEEDDDDDDDDDGLTQDPAQAPEEPWEQQGDDADADADDGLSSELAALRQVPGDSVGSSEWALEELPRDPEPTVGSGRSVELEDTLPDSTALHLCEGVGAASPNPPGPQESSETAAVPDTAPEAEGWLEEGDKPPAPPVPQSPEEEAGVAVAEGAEEEEGYFMVSAPSQEVSSVEEAEISEDFEEIKVEAAEGSQDELGAPGGESPVPEGKEHPGVLVGEADGNTEVPTGEAERPKGEDDTAELEEGPAVPGADPSCPGAAAGAAEEPARGPTGTEGSAAEPDEELHSTAELQRGDTGGTTLPGCSLGLAGQEEEEEEEPSVALHSTAMATPPAGLQAQAVPGETEQILGEKPSTEEETPGSDSREQLPEASPPQPGPALGQGGFPESIPGVLPAELPVDAVKDSDILEIVEQALEFTQELMGVAEGGQQGPGRVELSQDDSSPASSSEEEPTVREAEVQGVVGAENGLRSRASLEELPGFPEELLNGRGSAAPAREPPSGGGVMPPSPGGGTATALGAATLRGKLGAAPSPVPPALCLTPGQEPGSSGDE